MTEKDIIFEMYPELSPRSALFAAERAGLITKTLRDLYLQDYPVEPQVEQALPKPRWAIAELRETEDLFANKTWGEMESSEIDAVLDYYDPETREKALAYLRMRQPLDDGD